MAKTPRKPPTSSSQHSTSKAPRRKAEGQKPKPGSQPAASKNGKLPKKTAPPSNHPKLTGKAASLANLKKAPSHQPGSKARAKANAKSKRQTQPDSTASPHSSPAKQPSSPTPIRPLATSWAPISLPNRARQRRITHIDAWLQYVWHHDDGSMPLKNASHFAEELNRGVDIIYDDLHEMRDIYNFPIDYDTKRHGHYYTEEVAFSPFLQLSQSEMLALCIAELFIAGVPNMPVLPDLQSAVRKTLALFGDRLEFDPAKVAEKFTFAPSRRSHKVDPQHWHIITKALLLQSELSFNYTKAHGDGAGIPEDRSGKPVQMVYDDGSFYIVNLDDKRADYRNFQLGRFNTVEDTGANFAVPKDFNRDALLRKNFTRAFASGEAEDVILHFHPRVRAFVIDGNWHDTQKFSEGPNGILIMTMRVPIAADIVIWIGGFYDDCRVIAPATLRKEVMQKRQQAAQEASWPLP